MEFGRLVENVTDSYFDELEARLPAWDPIAFDLTQNNRWARQNFYEEKYYELQMDLDYFDANLAGGLL